MERLLVSLVVPGEYAGRQRFVVVADEQQQGESGEAFDAGKAVRSAQTQWQHDGWMLDEWLGGSGDECWLEQEWLWSQNLLGSTRVEVLSWRLYFGRFFAIATVAEPTGQVGQTSAASRQVTVNSAPEAPGAFALEGQNGNGGIGFAFECSQSFSQ